VLRKNNNKEKIKKKEKVKKVYQSAYVRLKFWSFYKSVEDTTPAGAIWFLSYPCYPAEIVNFIHISLLPLYVPTGAI